jgi:hypothetical protein
MFYFQKVFFFLKLFLCFCTGVSLRNFCIYVSIFERMISEMANLKFTKWNGYLKHYKPSKRVQEAPRKQYAKMLEAKLLQYENSMAEQSTE